LLEVIEVVASEHADDVFDGFLAALGMHAVVFPLFRRERIEQGEICIAHDAELFDAFARIALRVVAGYDPDVLVIGLDRGSGCAENRPDPSTADDFRVGEMRNDLRDRPFVRRWPLTEF